MSCFAKRKKKNVKDYGDILRDKSQKIQENKEKTITKISAVQIENIKDLIDSGKLNSLADTGKTHYKYVPNLVNLPLGITKRDILEEIYMTMPKYKGIKLENPCYDLYPKCNYYLLLSWK